MAWYRGRPGKVKDRNEAIQRIRKGASHLRYYFDSYICNKKEDEINIMLFENGEWILTDVETTGRSHHHEHRQVPIMLHAHSRSVHMCAVRGQGRFKYKRKVDKEGKPIKKNGYPQYDRETTLKKGDFCCTTCYKKVPDKPRFFHQLKEAQFK